MLPAHAGVILDHNGMKTFLAEQFESPAIKEFVEKGCISYARIYFEALYEKARRWAVKSVASVPGRQARFDVLV